MLSFADFVASFPANAVIAGSVTAQDIYYNIIWRDDVRIGFVDKSNAGLPALSACAKEIERFCSAPASDLDLTNPTVKQSIGRMVKSSIEPFGYKPLRKARMPLNLQLRYFSTAHVYSYVGGETQRIDRRIINA